MKPEWESRLKIEKCRYEYEIVTWDGKFIGLISRLQEPFVNAWKPMGVEPRRCPDLEFAIEWLVGNLAQ